MNREGEKNTLKAAIKPLKTGVWAALFAVLAAVCVFAIVWMNAGTGTVAEIVRDGEVIRRIDLSRVTAKETFTVGDGEGGYNVIEVEPGRIRVLDADCPDRVCVRTGWLSKSRIPILCVPHRLMIRITDADGAADAVAY